MTEKNSENPTRKIKIEKIVFSVGGTAEELEKGVKLLKIITEKKPAKMKSRKRIPTFGVRPGLEVGAVVTIRKNTNEILKKMLIAIDNKLRNNFSSSPTSIRPSSSTRWIWRKT